GDPQHITGADLLQPGAQFRVGAVDLVAGHPGREPSFGVQVGQDLAAQLGFGREHHLLGNPVAFAPVGVGGLLAGQIRAGADQCVSGRGSETAVHDVDGVGDPAGAADVLAFDPDGSG